MGLISWHIDVATLFDSYHIGDTETA